MIATISLFSTVRSTSMRAWISTSPAWYVLVTPARRMIGSAATSGPPSGRTTLLVAEHVHDHLAAGLEAADLGEVAIRDAHADGNPHRVAPLGHVDRGGRPALG